MNYMNNKTKLLLPLLTALVLAGSVTSVVTIASAASTDTSTVTTSSSQAQRTPPAAMGKVTAISGNTITITDQRPGQTTSDTTGGTTYTVDATNATVTKDQGMGSTGSPQAASTVSAIAVGDMISVDGTVSGTTVTATAIHDGFGGRGGRMGGPGGHGGFGGGTMGTVIAVNGTTLTVTAKDGGTYTVDASSATVKDSGAASTVSSIAVGDTVMIQGKVTTASMTATNIEDGVPTPPTSTTGSTDSPQATPSSTSTQ
jgi:riboflavin synthase alpha subunit